MLITVDNREIMTTFENMTMYYQEFAEKKKVEVEFTRANLDVCDVTDGNFWVERKTLADLIQSIRDGRSNDQLQKMIDSKKKCIMILEVGTYHLEEREQKAIVTTQAKFIIYGIPVIAVKDTKMFCYGSFQLFLTNVEGFLPKFRLIPEITPKNIENTAKALMQYHGIGETIAIKLADGVYPQGMNKIVTMSAEELNTIAFPNAQKVHKVIEELVANLKKS